MGGQASSGHERVMHMSRVFALDIGNSQLKAVLFDGSSRVADVSSPIAALTPGQLAAKVRPLLDQLGDDRRIWVASVVPEMRLVVEETADIAVFAPVFINIADHSVIPHCLATPHTTGIDRLLAARAARDLFFSGSGGIVVQCGTAMTVDWVDGEGTYRGGFILPGPALWLAGLENAAALPRFSPVDMKWEPELDVGNNTRDAILGGLSAGLPGAAQRAIMLVKKHAGDDVPVLLTGGWADKLAPLLEPVPQVESGLVLSAIRIVASQVDTTLVDDGVGL